jgi:hypothetical protein
MNLTIEPILRSVGIAPLEAQVTRHAFVKEHEDIGMQGIHADSTGEEILLYTSQQSANPRIFPTAPPAISVVFVCEGGDRAACGPLWRTADRWPTTVRSRHSIPSCPRTWRISGTFL